MDRRLPLTLVAAWLIWAAAPAWATSGNQLAIPTSASPGERVELSGPIVPAGEPADGKCEVFTSLGVTEPVEPICDYTAAGEFDASFTLPTTEEPGSTYAFEVCGPVGCAEGKTMTWSQTFELQVVQLEVPLLHCYSLAKAEETLRNLGLEPKPQSDVFVVDGSVPPAGTPVEPGDSVVLTPATVPSLHGMGMPRASLTAHQACATAREAEGRTQGLVVEQTPQADQPIRKPFQLITVQLEVRTTPTTTAPTTTLPTTPTTSTPPTSTPTTPSSVSSPTDDGGGGGDDGGGGDGIRRFPAWALRHTVMPGMPILAAAGVALIGVRSVQRLRLPVVDPAAVSISVGTPQVTQQITQGVPGRLSASFIVVRRDRQPWIEEHP
jgi:hypothetical protein